MSSCPALPYLQTANPKLVAEFNSWQSTYGYSFSGSQQVTAYTNFLANMRQVYAINTNASLDWW